MAETRRQQWEKISLVELLLDPTSGETTTLSDARG